MCPHTAKQTLPPAAQVEVEVGVEALPFAQALSDSWSPLPWPSHWALSAHGLESLYNLLKGPGPMAWFLTKNPLLDPVYVP